MGPSVKIPSGEKINLNPVTLSFRGTQSVLEEAYCSNVLESNRYLVEIRAVILAAGIYFCLFGILDVYLLPGGYRPLHFIRYAIVLPYVLWVLLFSYTRYFRKLMQLTFIVSAFVGGGGIIAMVVIAPEPVSYSYYAGLILVFMFLYSFGRVRFIWATLAGWLLIIVYEGLALKFTSQPRGVWICNTFVFICANSIGMASCYILEYFNRKNFFIRAQLRAETEKTARINVELEQRVEQRTALLVRANDDLRKEIEQRKMMEEELNFIREDLEKRVETRTAELIETNRELEKAKLIADASLRIKSEFLATMSHEIRTPMNAIIGMSELAMNKDIDLDRRNEYLTIIRKSSRTLLGIINDVLDLSKIEAGKLELEEKPFRIREYVEGVADMFFEMIHTKGIEFIVDIAPDIPVSVMGDSLRLQQVLLNLISNAMKFTEKGEICVSVRKGDSDRDTEELLFEVADTGIGMDLESNTDLFDAFAQADGSITRKYGGTGLGLTICKRIVGMMNGDIQVESLPGKGSIFRFSVRLNKDTDNSCPPVMELGHLTQGYDVGCWVRNDRVRRVLSEMLAEFGFRFRMLKDLDSVIGWMGERHGDVRCRIAMVDEDVLLNDDLDRLLACKAAVLSDQSVSLIFFGALKTNDQFQDLRLKGVDLLLTKPLKVSSVYDALAKIVGVKPRSVVGGHIQRRSNDIFKGMNILLVEDNAINQVVAEEILRLEGIRVVKARDGLEAVSMVRESTFDAVLMDVQMPKMDGIQATRIIRGELDISPESLPIIAMTAHVMGGDRERCIDAGMNDFVSKPVDRDKLFDVLARIVRKVNKASLETMDVDSRKMIRLPAKLPGIDIGDGMKRLGCEPTRYIELLNQFCKTIRTSIRKVRSVIDEGDLSSARYEVHNLKGASANISAVALFQIAKNIENRLAEEGLAGLEGHHHVNELEDAYEQLLESCRKLVTMADDIPVAEYS